jgi:hypothetical protein
MKHYSQFLLQNKVHKEIDNIIQDMFQDTINVATSAESFGERYLIYSDYYG